MAAIENGSNVVFPSASWQIGYIRDVVMQAEQPELDSLLAEVAQTQGGLRTSISPRYVHDERWGDLLGCLLLDGYKIENRELVAIEPVVEGTASVEDDMSRELDKSGLSEAFDIIALLTKSADAFRKPEPDYNACLNDARVALQRLATAIAKKRQVLHPGTFDDEKWGQVLAYLSKSGLITKQEEEGLAGVYGFASQGSHSPLLTQQEAARLGRHLVLSMCYFLVKLHNLSS